MKKVIIADDHELIRSSVCLSLASTYICDEATSYTALMHKLECDSYDLLILDLNLGDKNGIETIYGVNSNYSNLPILVLSVYPDDPYGLQAFKAGASGYLNKGVSTHELLSAVELVLDGKRYVSQALEQILEYGIDLGKKELNSLAKLSSREFEILSLIASGESYKDIAIKLCISPKTVSTYRSRIMEKLDLKSTQQLFRYSFEHHLAAY